MVCLEGEEGDAPLLNLHGKGNELGHLAHWSCWMEYLRRTNQRCLPVCPLCFTHISVVIAKKTIKLTSQNRGTVSYLKCCVRRNDAGVAKAAVEEYQADDWDADAVLRALEERMRKEKLSIGTLVNDYEAMVRVLVGSMKWTAEGLASAVFCSIIAESVLLCRYLVTTFGFAAWKEALDVANEFGSPQCHFYLASMAGEGTLKAININYLEMCKRTRKQKQAATKNLRARDVEMRAAMKDPVLRATLRDKYPQLPYVVERPTLLRRIWWTSRALGVKFISYVR